MLRGAAIASLLALTACASLVRPSPPPAAPPPPATVTPESAPREAGRERTLRVKASAYNSLHGQTDATPSLAAWGDRLEPGMKAIAVSHDLVALGLDRGKRVRIDGLEGEYVVVDRMSSRWQRKIDIYMGEDVGAARRWGIRDVEIAWTEGEGN